VTRSYSKKDQPHNFDQWVGAAFLRLLGNTQSEAAAAVGLSERTVRRWEARPEWSQAIREAESRWLKGLDPQMRRAMESAVGRLSADLQAGSREAHSFLKWWAERRFPEFAPPAKKREIEDLERPQYIVGAIPAGLIRRLRASEDETGL